MTNETPYPDTDLYLEELYAEGMSDNVAAATVACFFTAGSFGSAGSCAGSVSTGSTLSTAG